MSLASSRTGYTDLGNRMMDATLGTPSFGPIVRQPIPTDPDTVTLLHWLFAARGPIPLPTVVLDFRASAADGRLIIPASAGGGNTRRVWQVYPANRQLLYPSPYSPVIGGGAIEITEADWQIENGRTVIYNPAILNGQWRVVYSHATDAEVVQRGDGYEAYPTWAKLPRGYAACAPDTFRWFDIAVERAILQDTRAGKATGWTRLRNAVRRTAVRGQDITDLRDVFVPLKGGMGAFDLDGMFAWSDHPSAMPPPAGLNQNWIGYNFWGRDDATGDLTGVIPGVAGPAPEVRIGRGVDDGWRQATTYQDPDQYLYIEIGAALEANGQVPTGTATVFVSATREYDPAARWQAEIDLSAGTLVETIDGLELRGHLIPRSDLLRADNGSVLPEGQRLLNFGVSLKLSGRYQVRFRRFRLLSGSSTAWVQGNLAEAVRGAPLPYFPGAMPFAINGYTNTGNFIGYNGNPFHGYQMPDLWLALEDEAELIHAGLTAADLPLPDSDGSIIYPIEPLNANEEPKPVNLLLAEQQARFLADAQAQYQSDRGVLGPFAHTFVLNTAARHNIGSPEPHTWVYNGDDPNTRWVGYQARPVESLCRLVYLTRERDEAQDVRELSRDIAHSWLAWLDSAWPSLAGTPYAGMPTDFPGDGPPTTGYEDPHAAGIVLRALLWLRMAGDTDAGRAALAVRCWHYLESMWVTEGQMACTWSPLPWRLTWYGLWHGELIETMAMIVGPAKDSLPVGIERLTALDRLVGSYNWLTQWGVREV